MQKKLYLTLVFLFYSLIFSGNLYAVNGFANCPMVDGKIDVSELGNIGTNPGGAITCDAPVDSFSLTFYKLAMCTSDPDDFIRGNSTTDPCYYVWNTAEGDNSISFGVTKSSYALIPLKNKFNGSPDPCNNCCISFTGVALFPTNSFKPGYCN